MLDDTQQQPQSPLDPAVLSYLQGQGAPAPTDMPVDPGPASATGGVVQPSLLPPEVAQAAQSGFAPPTAPAPQQDYQLSPKQAAPIQKADAAADAAFAKAQEVQAKQQAKQAAYNATPEGQQQQAYQQQVAGNEQQADLAKQQGDVESASALKEADIKAQAAIDMKAEVQKQEAKRQEMLQQQTALHADMMKAIDVAQQKTIDPNRVWNNKSVGGKIALKMGIVLSGLGNGMSGNGAAPNQAAQMFEDDIKNDVEAQKANMGQANELVGMKRSALDDYMKIAGNADAAATMKQAEMRNMVASQLEANAAKFKSPQALLAAQQTAAVMRQKSAADLMDLAGKRITQQHQNAELANQRQQTAIAGGHLALAQKQFDWTQEKDKQQLAIDYLKATGEGKQKNAADLADRGVFVPQGTITDPDGKVQPNYKPLTNSDGTPYLVPKEMQKDVALKQEGYMKGMDAIDNLRKMRDENGGNFTNMSSDARAKIAEYERAIVGMHDAAGITRFSGDVIELMEKQLAGGASPTSILQNIGPALDQARQNLETDFDGTLRAAHYTGPKVTMFDPLRAAKPATTPDDEAFKHALTDNSKASIGEQAQEFGVNVEDSYGRGNGMRGVMSDLEKKQSESGGIGPARQRVLDNLSQLAASPDPKVSGPAAKQLQTLADQAQLAPMRRAAKAALEQAVAPKPTEEPGGPRGSVAHETMPGSR